MTPTHDAPDVLVIGAGVVGLSAALALQERGLKVKVADREGPAAGASAGNAGAFAFTDILPLASPGIFRKAPKWLLDPLGPLSVPPSYALSILPWMLRFWRACSPSRVAASAAAQTSLMVLSKNELQPFFNAAGAAHMLRNEGNLEVYEGEAQFRASLPGWKAREEHGIEFRHLNPAEMAEIQPGLSPRFTHGTFTPDWWSVTDPKLYVLALAEKFRANGGEIIREEIASLRQTEGGAEALTREGKILRAGRIVLSAGAFSHHLAASLGEKIPLETERGYNTTLPSDAFDLRTQVTFGGHGFVVTRLSTGLRVGGAVELGGLKLPPNYKRSEAMLKKAMTFLPGLKPDNGVQWMGFRPSMPDTLPVISPAKSGDRVIYAFGHGHLGLTQSTGTARLVAELATGVRPALDITPFSSGRF